MRVLMLTHEKNLNGASKSMLNLIDELKGYVSFFVVCPFRNGPVVAALQERGIKIFFHDCKRWMRREPKSRIKWFGVRAKWVIYNQFRNVLAAEHLKKKIRNLDIDIIHSNTSVINIGGILHKMTGIPHIWYIREFGKEDFGLNYLCGEAETYQYIGKRADIVITVSNALNKKVSQLIPNTSLRTIYNGVGNENIIDRKFSRKTEYSFLVTGTLQPGKGQDVAIKAVRELQNRGYHNFKLFIAGSGNVEWLKALSADCEDAVVFLGRVENMVELRQHMDIEIVCSKSEAFGRVTVEAMMGAMPVIGADTGGTPELIKDGETGLLYRQGNTKALADKMEFFLNNPNAIETMGLAAQKYAVQEFSIKRCAVEVYEAYKTLAENK